MPWFYWTPPVAYVPDLPMRPSIRTQRISYHLVRLLVCNSSYDFLPQMAADTLLMPGNLMAFDRDHIRSMRSLWSRSLALKSGVTLIAGGSGPACDQRHSRSRSYALCCAQFTGIAQDRARSRSLRSCFIIDYLIM